MNYIVRYGTTRLLGDFEWRGTQELNRGAEVIVRSDRGTEWGEILCAATDKSREYLELKQQTGRILRLATHEDRMNRDEVIRREQEEFRDGKTIIEDHKLQMQLVDIERIFGGERLIFFFLSEKRIDFRELVKSLAKRFQTRIEMRQIGVRDEAKLLADYGDCGKPVCCNTHLKEMPPVSMKMAKLQKANLDPNKISGRCGRLKCCLRYEYDTYEEYQRTLPSVGSTVLTKNGQGKVLAQEILSRKLLIDYGERRMMADEKEILTVVSRSQSQSPQRDDLDDTSDPGFARN